MRGSLEGDDRLRVHSALPLVGAHPVEVVVAGQECRVVVQLDARLGEYLPGLATAARRKIADALGRMTGLAVGAVDVTFSGVFPAGA